MSAAQAPRAWFEKLTQFLLSQNLLQSKNDTSLFIYHTDNVHLFVLIYMDNILIIGNSSFHITELITALGKAFSLKDLGYLNYFLGVEVIQYASGVILSQQQYIQNMLNKANMGTSKPVTTPFSSSIKLTKHGGIPFADHTKYRQLVGFLQYLSLTRPESHGLLISRNSLLHCMRSLMRIGSTVLKTVVLPLVLQYSWVIISFHGVPERKKGGSFFY